MKTAISIPDDLFYAAEETAAELGIPRSQLVARALKEYISKHHHDHITEQLNRVYEKIAGNEKNEDAGIETLRKLTKNDTW